MWVFYYKISYQGWYNTLEVGSCSVTSEDSLDAQINVFGYNMFLSKNDAKECLQEIKQIYEKYKDK